MVRVSTEDYPAWLRASRVAANLSQAELAERLGVSARAVQTWEAGRFPWPKHRRALDAFFKEHGEVAA